MVVDVAYDGDTAMELIDVNEYDVLVLEAAGVTLDTGLRQVRRGGRLVPLSRKEIAVLEVLMRARGNVVSTEELLERAWDEHGRYGPR